MSTTSKQQDAHCNICISLLIRPPDVSLERLKLYPWTLFFLIFFFFSINPPCSAATQRTAIECISEVRLFVGKASTIGIEISPTPFLVFTGGGVKSAKFGVVLKHHSNLSRRVWKRSKICEIWNKSAMLRWSPYVLAKFGEVGSTHPWESSVSSAPPPKIARENVLNRR